jgi:hypothetical protein
MIQNSVILQGGELHQVLGQGQSLADALPPASSQPGARQTTAQLLDGTASAAAILESGFSTDHTALNDNLRVSDIFHLTGVPVLDVPTGRTDTFVLQLAFAGTLDLNGYLAWYDPAKQEWVNAVDGNIGGSANFLGNKSYNSATDFVLGNYGVDTTNGLAWAVLNHNSEFALVPEPTPLALIAAALLTLLTLLLLLRSRRRDCHR